MPAVAESVAVARIDPLADFESAAFYAVARGGFYPGGGSKGNPHPFFTIRRRWRPLHRP